MIENFEVTANEVKSHIKGGDQLFFVNIRHHQDWDLAVMKVRGALRVNDNEVEEHLGQIPQDRPIIVYSSCPGDEPSIRTAKLLQQHGWNDVHFLVGGFNAYCREGLPVEAIGEGSTVKK